MLLFFQALACTSRICMSVKRNKCTRVNAKKHAGIKTAHVTSALCNKLCVKINSQPPPPPSFLTCFLSGGFFPSCSLISTGKTFYELGLDYFTPNSTIRLGNKHQPEAKTCNNWLFMFVFVLFAFISHFDRKLAMIQKIYIYVYKVSFLAPEEKQPVHQAAGLGWSPLRIAFV